MTDFLVQFAIDEWHEKQPEKHALVCKDDRLTYSELFGESNRIANCMRSSGITRQNRVVTCLTRSVKSILAILGVLKTDSIYIPIDPKAPVNRIKVILEDCIPDAIICDLQTLEKVLTVLAERQLKPIIFILDKNDNSLIKMNNNYIYQDEIDEYSADVPLYKNIDTDFAYILYTSGSTGKPKGVVISHCNIINYINWAKKELNLTSADNILSTAPFHFDMSTFDIYASLMSGAKLIIVPESYLLFPIQILRLIESEQITIWKSIASLLTYLSKTESLEAGRIKTLNKILFAGEVFPTKHLIHWMDTYPDKEFYNAYGPTEATGVSIFYKVTQKPQSIKDPIPLGKACSNTEVFLLKEDGRIASAGEKGEICIRGAGLSAGYWNDVEKTNNAFVINPITKIPGDRIYKTGDIGRLLNDGNIEFVGRKDSQIKYMGYRIELSDIENAILNIEEVDEASVILFESNSIAIPELIAFFTSKRNMSSVTINSELENNLPPYMIPKHIIFLDELPRTDRGKVDRVGLQKVFLEHAGMEKQNS